MGDAWNHWNGRHYKGYSRAVKALKREESEIRNSNTLHENTKAHRLGKCDCDKGEQ